MLNVTQYPRIGIGYDIHPLVPNRKLILGGVHIPCELGLDGHSDADCLSHAIADAILGGMGLPDIGHFFPNTELQHKNMDSQHIIRRAVDEAAKEYFRLNNIDTVIIAERPRISPYIAQMKAILSKSLRLDPSRIGIKATTHEGLGVLGRGEGIAAHAVCTLVFKEA